jgi:hypothetical protein
MPSLTAQQRQTAIDAIIHMEGMDGSKDPYGPTKPGWGGGNSALSYGQFQNDISQSENKYDAMSNSQALLERLNHMSAALPGSRGYSSDPLSPYSDCSYPSLSNLNR